MFERELPVSDSELLSREVSAASLDDPGAAPECLRQLSAYRSARLQSYERMTSGEFPRPFGRFRLLELIGHGGCGVVYRAADPRLDREVAIKVPRIEYLWTTQVRLRFLVEGKAAAVLDHPNIVPVYEAGEVDGVCYLAAAYCPGETLAQWLRGRDLPVAPEQVVRMVAALADGVGHAHSRGVLHRDLKPSNVLLSPDPESPRVTDFGLARLGAGGSGETATGQVMGTPGYMAPEQAAGDNHRVGTHTDVYALGIILYEMLTGSPSFADIDHLETIRRVTACDLPRPLQEGRRLPRDLESICLKCLEENPDERYPSGRELADDLRRFLAGEPVSARPLRSWVWVAKWFRRRRAAAGFLAASLVAVLVLVAAAVWHSYEVGRTNDALQVALSEAERHRVSAESRMSEARVAYYSAQVRVTAQLLRNGQGSLMRASLDALAPQPGDPDYREFTWRLLWRQALNDTVLQGHRKLVRAAAYSLDGKVLYTVADDGVRRWDADTGRLLDEFRDIGRGVPQRLAVSADGRQVAVGSGLEGNARRLRVWASGSGAILAEHIYQAGVGPGDLLFTGDTLVVNRVPEPNAPAGAVLLWNWRTDDRRYLLPNEAECTAVAVSHDGALLAAACHDGTTGESTVQLLSVADGLAVGALPAAKGRLEALAFAPDGKTLAGGGGEVSLRVWDVVTRTVLVRSESPDEQTASLAFDPTGRIVVSLASIKSSKTKGRLRLRVADTGGDIVPPEDFTTSADILAVAPSGGGMALADYQTVRVRRLRPFPAFVRLAGHPKESWGVAYTPDGRSLLTSSDDWTVAVWDSKTHARRHTYQRHHTLVSYVAASPVGGWAVSGDFRGTITQWEVNTGRHIRTLTGHERMVRGVAVTTDGSRIASAGRDQTTRLWDAGTGEQLARWQDHVGEVRGVAFTPDGRRLVSVGSDQTVVVRNVGTGEVMRFESNGWLGAVAVTPDGVNVVAGGESGVPRIWELATGRTRAFTGGHTAGIEGLAVSPDGRTLATAGLDKTVRLWHLPTGVELCVLGPLSDRVHAVAFSPDGRKLAAGLLDGSVLIWDTNDEPPDR